MALDKDRLWALLRGWPATRAPQRVIHGHAKRADYFEERGYCRHGGQDIPYLMIRPRAEGSYPAVLYCHAHGNRYTLGSEELIEGRPSLHAPYGSALARLGIASLAIDLAPFGKRQPEGPESALAKAAHWRGESLMGRMLTELSAALAMLAAHPQVNEDRIATLGFSMGATHAYWMAALHPDIRATAHLCAFADIAPLIDTGAHDLHGPYMTVPGLLREGDMGDVAALIAPRPQLICSGAQDPLTPDTALAPAIQRARAAYGGSSALEVHIDPNVGHTETADMRAAVLRFLERHLLA